MPHPLRLLALLTASTLFALGCSGSSPAPVCDPGATQGCVGVGGCSGGQSCLSDGSGWDSCQCAPSSDAGTDAGTDAGVDSGPPPACGGTGASHVYLIDALAIDATSMGTSAGFDLDGVATTSSDPVLGVGCGQQDFSDPGGTVTGIDNSAGPFLAALALIPGLPDFQASLDASVNSGTLVRLVRVDLVDDFGTDDCVRISILAGEPFDPALDPATPLTGTEAISIDPSSLDANGDPLELVPGHIASGRLETEAPLRLTLTFAPYGDVSLQDVHLAADIDATALTAGDLGAFTTVAELTTFTTTVLTDLGYPALVSTVTGIVESFADIHDQSTPGAEPCDALSAGLIFTAVQATDVAYP